MAVFRIAVAVAATVGCLAAAIVATPVAREEPLAGANEWLTTAAHWDATTAQSSTANHAGLKGASPPTDVLSVGATLRTQTAYPLDMPEESLDPFLPSFQPEVPDMRPRHPYVAPQPPRVAAPTAMPAPPAAVDEPPRMVNADNDDANGEGGGASGYQPPLFPPMAPHPSEPCTREPTPGVFNGGGGGRGGAPLPVTYPMPRPSPEPMPVEPVPVESISPEDDDDIPGAWSSPAGAIHTAPISVAPETADGLEELQAQLRQLRWAESAPAP
ncbi:hypothetical protein MMPV_001256 [Pyropia vietnamensis]